MKKIYKQKLFLTLSIMCGLFVSTLYVKERILNPSQNTTLKAFAAENPKPEGNVIARGEDGVPWELYENGYLLFKPEPGKDTLIMSSNENYWKIKHGSKIKYVGFSDKVYAPEISNKLFSSKIGIVDYKFKPVYIDARNIDTSKVTNMTSMFEDSDKLISLDVSNWDTSKVTQMQYMFMNVSELKILDVRNWDTSKVTNTRAMFNDTSSLSELDVSQWNTSNITDMSSMFQSASSLTTLDVSQWNTSNVTSMRSVFGLTSQLVALDVSHWNTNQVTDMSYMFSYTKALKELDVSRWNVSRVTNISYMFANASALDMIDVSQWQTSNVTNMSSMFSNASRLTNIDVSKWDTRNVTNMSAMFQSMKQLAKLDVTHFNTSKVTNMYEMFNGSSKLESLDVSSWDTRNATDMRDMFNGMKKLKELKLGDKFKSDGIRTITSNHDYGDQYTDKWHKIDDKSHAYAVNEWADVYTANPTASAGAWVREEKAQDATLTFEGETFPPVKVSPDTTELPMLPRPSQPKLNHKFKGWSKTQNGSPLTRNEVTQGETINLYPVWELVNNTKTRTEKISITKTYQADNASDYGTRNETLGVEGEKTITTTYKVTPYTGELTDPVDKEVITTPMKPTVVTIGTKPKVEMIQSENSDPVRRTTKYIVNPDTGDVTETYTTELPATGTLGTIISIVSAASLITLTLFLNKLKKTR